jgi:hypothetical protein
VRQGGREIEVRTELKANPKGSGDREALFARVEERLSQLAHAEAAGHAAVLVAPGGRSVQEWSKALGAVGGADAGDYRSAAVPPSELWRIVLDPSSVAGVRAGAAVALRRSLDDEGRARMRVAADESASPKIRVMLEAVASGAEERAIEEALAACAEDMPSSQPRPKVAS